MDEIPIIDRKMDRSLKPVCPPHLVLVSAAVIVLGFVSFVMHAYLFYTIAMQGMAEVNQGKLRAGMTALSSLMFVAAAMSLLRLRISSVILGVLALGLLAGALSIDLRNGLGLVTFLEAMAPGVLFLMVASVNRRQLK